MKRYVYLLIGTIFLLGMNKVKAYDSYSISEEIYFNPVTGKTCSPSNANSSLGTKTGCMKWYVINDSGENDSSIDVILDHNIVAQVDWKEDEQVDTVNQEYTPSLRTTLEENTSDWKKVSNIRNITTSDIVTTIMNGDFTYSTSLKYSSTTTNYSRTFADNFYFYNDLYTAPTNYVSYPYTPQQTNKAKASKEYGWLFDNTEGCTAYGCNIEGTDSQGYWTSTTFDLMETSGSSPIGEESGTLGAVYRHYGHVVSNEGRIEARESGDSENIGIRPVVTISKADLNNGIPSTIENLKEKIIIILSDNEENLDSNSVLKVERLTSNSSFFKLFVDNLRKLLNKNFKITLYDINIVNLSNNTKLQPSKTVKLLMPIPDEYDISKISVYCMNELGELEKLNYTINDNNIEVNADHFSLYGIVEEGNEEADEYADYTDYTDGEYYGDDYNDDIDNPRTGLKQLPIYGVIFMVIAGVVFFKIKNKTKFNK